MESDHQRHFRLLDDRKAFLDPLDRQRHRLLAQDHLAGLGDCLDQIGMGVGGCRDEYGIRVLGLDDLLDRGDLGAYRLRQTVGGLSVGIGDIGDFGPARPCERPSMDLADTAGAQNPKADHEISKNGTNILN